MTTQFEPFPPERQQAIEQRVKAREPYQSPHLPEQARKPKVHAQGLTSQAPIQEPTIPVSTPGFTNPVAEAEAVLIDLPSNYVFYEFKDLYIKPFKGRHLAKLSRASDEGSFLQIVEVVSSVLSNTRGDQNLAFDLALPDFYFVLYWLRQNSYTKYMYTHTTTCENEAHVKKVMDGQLPQDSLVVSEIVRKSSLKINKLEHLPNPELYVLQYPGATCKSVTARDTVEMMEHPQFAEEDFRYAAEIAAYLDIGHPASLQERIAVVEDMCADDISTIKAYEKAIMDYGVVESINVKCKECGASWVSKITLDAHSFLPKA
jgi:hypothetical protein